MSKQPVREQCPQCNHRQTETIGVHDKHRNKRVAGLIERVKVLTVTVYRCPSCGHVFTRTVQH